MISLHGRALGFDPLSQTFYSNGAPLNLPSLPRGQGKDIYVSSLIGHPGSTGKNPIEAISTLDAAFAKATANKGDRIIILPGHSETITGAGGIAHDVAGVAVIGLGDNELRPTFLMDAGTTVTYAITANDAYLENLVFVSGHSNVVACITTTKKGTWINNCFFRNNTTNEDFLTPIKATSTTDNDSDRLRVTNCRWVTSDSDDLEFIEINANIDGAVIANNFVVNAGTASPLILCATGKILTGALIENNKLQNKMTANELFFSNDQSTNTGLAINNYCGHRDTTTTHDLGLESSGIDIFNLWSTSTAALQGGVIPAADVNN